MIIVYLVISLFIAVCILIGREPVRLGAVIAANIFNPAIYVGSLSSATVLTLFVAILSTRVLVEAWQFLFTKVLVCFMVVQLTYSVMSQGGGLLAFGNTLACLVAFALFVRIRKRFNEKSIFQVVYSVAPIIVMQAASVVLFRVSPAVERSYYESRLGDLLLGRSATELFSGWSDINNVIDPERAGGILFVNANRGTLFLGVSMMIFFGLFALYRQKLLAIIALICFLGIAAGGSKTGLLLVVVLPLAALLMGALSARKDPGIKIGLLFGSLCLVAVGIQGLTVWGSGFISDSKETLIPRQHLWREAVVAIAESPVMGLGYGGWSERWLQGGVQVPFTYRPMPAHNWVLIEWLDTGLIGVTLAMGICVTVLASGMRAINRRNTVRFARAHSFLLASTVWVFAHGLADNTGVLGTSHTAVLMALAVGICVECRDVSNRLPGTMNLPPRPVTKYHTR